MYVLYLTHRRTTDFLLKADFTQNFNKFDYLFLKPTPYDSRKSKYMMKKLRFRKMAEPETNPNF